MLITPDRAVIERAVMLEFNASNNEAECKALLSGLKMARELEVTQLIVYCDS